MSTPISSELLSRLEESRQALPGNGRFGQLIANMALVARGTDPGAIWEMEDQELLAAVNWQIEELQSRRGSQVA